MANGTSTNEPLWHYTSQQGLLGILRTKKLWATNIRYLNDSREYIHALDVRQKEIERRLKGSTGPRAHLRKYLLDHLQSYRTRFEHDDTGGSLFVFSLSACRDDLSQWRAYCPQGTGFSLGFDVSEWMGYERYDQSDEERDFTLSCWPCIYGKEAQHEFAEILDFALACVEMRDEGDPGPSNLDEAAVQVAHDIFRDFDVVAARMKDAAFDAERETRLIVLRRDSDYPILVRQGRNGLVPYVEIELDRPPRLPLREIVVGPSPHQQLQCRAVEAALRMEGIFGVEVSRSNVPYRNW
jgi:hypothetical protein